MRALLAILGQERRARPDLGEIFRNRLRVPNLDPVVLQAGNEEDGESKSNSARVDGSSVGIILSLISRPASLHRSQPRSDHDKYVFVADR